MGCRQRSELWSGIDDCALTTKGLAGMGGADYAGLYAGFSLQAARKAPLNMSGAAVLSYTDQ